jgi:hypothetical protein
MAVGDLRVTSILKVNVLTDVAGTATRTQLYLASEASFEPTIKEITYEGDGSELIVYRATGFAMTAKFQSVPKGLLTAFAKTAVTASLETNETERVYWMADADATGVVCGIEVACSAIDDTANATRYLRIVVPVGTLSTLTPPSVKTSDKSELELKFSGKKTSVDIAGDALPGVPSGGAYWYYSILTALP